MLARLVMVVALVVTASAAHAADVPPPEVIPYAQARQVLLARGFVPYVMPGAPVCDEDGPRCFPELLSCKQKRHWICDYTWRQGKTIYQLETHSDVPMVDSFYCLVNCTAAEYQPNDSGRETEALAKDDKSP